MYPIACTLITQHVVYASHLNISISPCQGWKDRARKLIDCLPKLSTHASFSRMDAHILASGHQWQRKLLNNYNCTAEVFIYIVSLMFIGTCCAPVQMTFIWSQIEQEMQTCADVPSNKSRSCFVDQVTSRTFEVAAHWSRHRFWVC